MTMLIREYPRPVFGPREDAFLATVYADARADGLWEGWIQFVEIESGDRYRTDRETVQSGIEGIRYWSTGIRDGYLEGALRRALRARERRWSELRRALATGRRLRNS